MKIATISDTHNRHEEINVPMDADIVIHAGDVSGKGSRYDIEKFLVWFGGLPNTHKVMVAGNHDFGFERDWLEYKALAKQYGVEVLYDESIAVEGLIIWGSPVQPEFCNWAFNRSRTIEDSMSYTAQAKGHEYIGNHWDKIPDEVDIVITHGPVYGILDLTYRSSEHVGCKVLLEKLRRVKPLLHVCGHIHEERGVHVVYHGGSEMRPTTYVNASSLNLQYQPYADTTFVFDIDKLHCGESYGRD